MPAPRWLRRVVVVLSFAPGLATIGAVGIRASLAPRSSPVVLVVPTRSDVSSAVLVARAGARTLAIVADADRDAILTFDLEERTLVGRTPALGTPTQLLLAPDGNLYVTLREAAKVGIFRPSTDANAFVPVGEISTAVEPIGMALSADGETLAVVSGWGHALETFSARSRTRKLVAQLEREPRAVAIDRAGVRAFVAHSVGSRVSIVDLGAGTISEQALTATERIDPQEFLERWLVEQGAIDPRRPDLRVGCKHNLTGPCEDLRPRTMNQGYSIARFTGGEQDRFFFPAVTVNPGDVTAQPASSLYGGGVDRAVQPSVTVFDGSRGLRPASLEFAAERDLEAGHRSEDGAATSCVLPRAAAVDEASGSLFVGCIGSDEVIEYDARVDDPLAHVRRRWSVPRGPLGIAVWPKRDRLVVWSAFDRTAIVLDRVMEESYVTMAPETRHELSRLEIGRIAFFRAGDSRIARDGRACASCHPDGRDDGLTWSGPDGARQTPMLAGRLDDTAPYGWSGASATVDDHVQKTLERLGGMGLGTSARSALVTYLGAMRPPARATEFDPRIERGRAVFTSAKAGCASCHVPEYGFTDGEQHDVGSLTDRDRVAVLDTPSLRYLGGTAPYFHDGRYANLRELLRKTDGAMGTTSLLPPSDLDALIVYLESL